MNKESLEIIYKESCEARKIQQTSIEHINNKINWFIVFSSVCIVFLLNRINDFLDLVILSMFFISLFLLILILFFRNYKIGVDITKSLNSDKSYLEILKNIILKNDICKKRNDKIVKNIIFFFNISIIIMLIALFLLIFKILIYGFKSFTI